jgi:hypothetical protein
MNQSSALELQVRLAMLAITIEASRYDDIQNSPVHLPRIFAGNESERREMTKGELETFIDARWESALRQVESEILTLQTRVADTEKGIARLTQQIGS